MGAKIDETTKAEEARRLATLIKQHGATSQAEFARACDVPGGKSMLSQHLKGNRPISLECAVAYAIGLNRPLSDISPRLAETIAKIQPAAAAHARQVASEPVAPAYIDSDIAALLAAVERLSPEDARTLLPVITRIADSAVRSKARRRGTPIEFEAANTAGAASR